MRRRHLAAGAIALTSLISTPFAARAQQPVEIQFWHGLNQPLGGMLEQLATDFNATQAQYKVVPTFRGGYAETAVAAIAAFRANTAPHILQMFEVGTGTMMSAGRAIKPLHEIVAETGVAIDPNDVIGPVAGYYAAADGKMMALPFNSSTTIAFYNKDMFQKAGLNPNAFPATWQGVEEAARKLKAAGIACPMTTSWPSWVMVEQFLAIHDVPLASRANGFEGLNTELNLTNPLMVRHLTNLVNWQKEGLFRYAGRDSAGDALFPAGECAITFASSGVRARTVREARFQWGAAMLPYYEGVQGAPRNSIIGGAAFWVMNRGPNARRTPEELKGVAEFFRYITSAPVMAKWHQDTGYVPVTRSAYEATKAAGYYQQNPGADVPIEQMLRGGDPTPNSRGIRLGGFIEIRNIIQEEMERAFQGQATPEQALQSMNTRGNQVLRNFERTNRNN
ncbi:sn-glycerol-3-phosphate ABC transporter substrate-binding protein UgpB [Roseomonas xinghualingensis]|uniref:sn-glycerol-3-phosphate ABC transporter substrate-binding protein UgpB n=1 Tax=Roseomonas xinghualingensis TaxID=2986475 RepID=UPI0021F190DC|nr:sn-glycerol-3-phosphate ABC transporter substrate-binding protein UgpB [Roseomonas sp. SXEYE001]MCV4209530.1 sn-glycerol-3-phosphate ABC transporter substrate-binding protein UgpB [Roseomonas sp. SXEYE001]